MNCFLLTVLLTVVAAHQRLHDLPEPDVCKNGGQFVDGQCKCTLRYEGTHCEQERCLNGGRRYNYRGKVGCRCPFGLAGDRCEKVTHCEPGKGKLVNGKCECFDRNTGIHCQERLCYNGIPTGGSDGLCLCDVGFTGPFCDEALICENSGSITPENECACQVGYTGERCELCAPGYLPEGGSCVPEVSESSLLAHTGSLANRPYAWPIVVMGCGAAMLAVLVAAVSVMILRKWKSKPSRVSSVQGDGEGTDV
ncbi:unnamed protein product [Auanema sp. JU1783]|nr:unnamed protein product [Auanema sp. JU1783]